MHPGGQLTLTQELEHEKERIIVGKLHSGRKLPAFLCVCARASTLVVSQNKTLTSTKKKS